MRLGLGDKENVMSVAAVDKQRVDLNLTRCVVQDVVAGRMCLK